MRKNVIAIGYQDENGHIVTTDVLSMNFPELTPDQIGRLSWILCNLPNFKDARNNSPLNRQMSEAAKLDWDKYPAK